MGGPAIDAEMLLESFGWHLIPAGTVVVVIPQGDGVRKRGIARIQMGERVAHELPLGWVAPILDQVAGMHEHLDRHLLSRLRLDPVRAVLAQEAADQVEVISARGLKLGTDVILCIRDDDNREAGVLNNATNPN